MAIIVLIGASGSGKSTVGRRLEESGVPQLVSFTTREKRVGEAHGVDYYFTDKKTIEGLHIGVSISEISEYNDNYYGLFSTEIHAKLAMNEDAYFIANADGARQLVDMFPDEVIVFWLSVTIETMVKRMRERGDSEENILSRVEHAIDTRELHRSKGLDVVKVDANEDSDSVFYKVLVKSVAHKKDPLSEAYKRMFTRKKEWRDENEKIINKS